jgi:biotin carboxyl carrier protein
MNLKQVESIVELFEKVSIHKLVVGDKTMSLTLTRGNNNSVTVAATEPVIVESAPIVEKPLLLTLQSTGVGYVKIKVNKGNKLKKGQVAFSVTSMNLEHDYKVEQDGIVHDIFVEDGMAVEFGQKLIDLEVG